MIGDRHNAGKPAVSMILEARYAMEGAAKVLEFGRKKYSRGNWRLGLRHVDGVAEPMARHLIAWLAGEDVDPESGLPHVDHIHVNAMFLAELTRTHPELDDRPQIAKAVPTQAPVVYGEIYPHTKAAEILRDLGERDDDIPEATSISPAGAQSGTPISQVDEE